MKKIIMVLPLILIINKAVAGHVGFSSEENLLVYIPVLILIIWWLSKIIRKNYLIYKSELADKVQKQQSETIYPNKQINTDKEIPEFFREKDVFGLDKASIKIDPDAALHQ